ncbi:MAG TPA: hypothetical protein GXZ48_05955 [Acholeplasmataceae bacterium]|jgi:putative Mn2+ efflux pump MntP|nr:hypothetical protein [Acholeplasmataceae bacterium]
MFETIILSLLIAIALSVDASLACFAYATNNKKTINYAPFFIGAFHFIFPFISFTFFKSLIVNLESVGKLISSLIFILLGIICFFDKEVKQHKIFSITSVILLAVGVSIDSLLVGISLCSEIPSILIPASIFGIISFLLSFLAIFLGVLVSKRINTKIDFLVGIFFIILGVLIYFDIV